MFRPLTMFGPSKMVKPAREVLKPVRYFACKHILVEAMDDYPRDLGIDDGRCRIPCLCETCHKVKTTELTRKLYLRFMQELREVDKLMDKIAEDARVEGSSPMMILEQGRLHARRQDIKSRYKKQVKELWKVYVQRWKMDGVPALYAKLLG